MTKNISKLITAFVGVFLLQTAAYASLGTTTISCDLDAEHSASVDKIDFLFKRVQGGSMFRTYEITFRDGTVDDGFLDQGVLEDQFGNPLVSSLGKPYQQASGTMAGDIIISFACAVSPGLTTLRCLSQGSGEAAYASAVLYVDGEKLDFRGFGNLPTCTRTVRRHL